MALAYVLLLLQLNVAAAVTTGAEEQTILLFSFFGVALGALVTFTLNRLRLDLPYTVVLLTLGFAFGVWVSHDEKNWAAYGNGLTAWQGLPPELIFYAFLSVLIFGDASSLNWHHVKSSLAQSTLLAGPGVLLGAFATGLFMYFAMPLGWSWNLCMLFGSVLSATDPVAVVSILNDAGAPSSLTILIIGESLMNDGTAIVLFKLYFNMMEGEKYSPADVIIYFISSVLGSPAIGILFGFVGVYCLSKASNPSSHDDVTIQIAISFSCAYFVFFFAEYECGLSGVLATATAGVVFAWLSPTTIINQENMTHIWHFAEWLCNTLIFLLTGLLIATITSVHKADVGYLLIVYVFLNVLRFAIIALMYPVLSRIGLSVSIRDAVFMSFAGLRGGLACALGLVVKVEHHSLGLTQEIADRVFFYIAGVAALTLLINATAANYVLLKLGLLDDLNVAGARMTVNQVCYRLRSEVLKEVEETVMCKHINTGVHWSDLIEYNTLLQKHEEDIVPTTEEAAVAVQEIVDLLRNDRKHPHEMSVSESTNDLTQEKAHARWRGAINREVKAFQRKKLEQQTAIKGKANVDEQILGYCRSMFLSLLRTEYWALISTGKLPRNNAFSTQVLLYSVDIGMDNVYSTYLGDWAYIKSQSIFTDRYSTDRFLRYMIETFQSYLPETVVLFLKHQRARQLYFRVQILLNFIEAHEMTQSKYDAFLLPNGQCCDISEAQILAVKQESQNSIRQARDIVNSIDHADVVTIATMQAGHYLLHRQSELVKNMLHEGFIDMKSADQFNRIIDHDTRRLRRLKQEREKIRLMRQNSSMFLIRNSPELLRAKSEGGDMADDKVGDEENQRAGAAVADSKASGIASITSTPPSLIQLSRRTSDSRIELKKFKEALHDATHQL